ncbi:MAG: hypothetical protein ACOCWJ_01020 [Verrucomicrobiota bacterium]
MATNYSSPRIAKELTKRFGERVGKSMKADMRIAKQVNAFVAKVESAEKSAARSKLVFK